MQQQIAAERTAASKKDADTYHMREELSALQFSERTLREERSRILSVRRKRNLIQDRFDAA